MARRVAQDLLISKWLAQSCTLNSRYDGLCWVYTSKPEGIEATVAYDPFQKNIETIAKQPNGFYLGKRGLMLSMSDNYTTSDCSFWQQIGIICNIY